MYTRTPTMFLDFKLDPGANLEQAVPLGWTAFVYILAGHAKFGKCFAILSIRQTNIQYYMPIALN